MCEILDTESEDIGKQNRKALKEIRKSQHLGDYDSAIVKLINNKD